MLKLARWSTTHRRLVVIGWIVMIVAIGTLASYWMFERIHVLTH